MKHPGHSTAKNEYSGRSSIKLNLTQKEKLQQDMKAFTDRMQDKFKDKLK